MDSIETKLKCAGDTCVEVAENFFDDSDGAKADLMRAAKVCEEAATAVKELLAACRQAKLQLGEIQRAVFDNQPISNGWFKAAFDQLEPAIAKVEGKA